MGTGVEDAGHILEAWLLEQSDVGGPGQGERRIWIDDLSKNSDAVGITSKKADAVKEFSVLRHDLGFRRLDQNLQRTTE